MSHTLLMSNWTWGYGAQMTALHSALTPSEDSNQACRHAALEYTSKGALVFVAARTSTAACCSEVRGVGDELRGSSRGPTMADSR